MRSKSFGRLAIAVLMGAGSLPALLQAQDAALPREAIRVDLAQDAPLALAGFLSNESRQTARGAAVVIDLHVALTFRNVSTGRINGVVLRVVAQEATAGGKGSIAIPSMNLGPGESFPVRIDMQLVRPSQAVGGPSVKVDLDGVLSQGLGFYGADTLHSRRYLTACAVESQRDREFFKRVLAQSGKEALGREIREVAVRQQSASLNVRVVPRAMAVTSAGLPPEHPSQFAFVQFPDSPVDLVQGSAQVSGNEARTPNVEVHNRSGKPLKYVELGWVLADQSGQQSVAASLASAERDLYLPPDKTNTIHQETTLRLFTKNGQPANVQQMTGFVSQVEFADGKVWVPTRQNLQDPAARKVVSPSAEEQRLADLYASKGLDAVVEELKK